MYKEHPENLPYELLFSGKSCRKYNLATYRQVIQEIESDGVQVLAFGINTDEPAKFFTNFEKVDPLNIYDALVRHLKRIVSKK